MAHDVSRPFVVHAGIVSKAAGDTVRWQLAETTSGDGAAQQTHILIKPLERDLKTNMVLTTSRRVILIALRSGSSITIEEVGRSPVGRAAESFHRTRCSCSEPRRAASTAAISGPFG